MSEPKKPGILKSGLDKSIIKSMEEMNDLQRQTFRFGLTKDVEEVNGVEMPKIVSYIYTAWRNKRPEDEEFLKDELIAHGINYDSSKDNINGKFTKMAYILYRIAGCTYDEIKGSLSLEGVSFVIKSVEDTFIEQMDLKVQERSEFMLSHPQLDWKKERIGTRELKSISEMLQTIKSISGLEPLEIFKEKNIPLYATRKIKTSKSIEHRNLKVVLDEIVLVLTNPNWKEIERFTKRKKAVILSSVTNSFLGGHSHGKMLSEKLVERLVQKRIEFINSPTARMYPTDNVDYVGVLEKLKAEKN